MFFTQLERTDRQTDTQTKRHKNRCNVTGIIYGGSC